MARRDRRHPRVKNTTRTDINFDGIPRVIATLDRETRNVVDGYATRVVYMAKNTVHVVTGDLRRSIRKKVDGMHAVIKATMPYADIEETREGDHAYLGPAADAMVPSLRRYLKRLGKNLA